MKNGAGSRQDILAQVQATPDGGVCRISAGTYDITQPIRLEGRRNLTIDGGGSRLVCRYRSGSASGESSDAFYLLDCEGVTVRRFVIDTDRPVNLAGRVEEIDREAGDYILAPHPAFRVTGDEALMMQDSYDDEGSFDGKFTYYCRHPDPTKITWLCGEILVAATYIGCPYTCLPDGRLRIRVPRDRMGGLAIGQNICIRHSAYGPTVFLLKNARQTVISDVTVHAAGGMGIVVLPRSEDLVLERFRIETEPGSPAPMAANCDGVHIAGLCGKLVMRDCVFSGLGDDALNIHSTAATVAACDTGKERLLCRYTKRNPDGRLPLTWCRTGDRIAVLDTETARTKGLMTVRDFDGDHLLYADADCEILAGDRLQNTAFSAAVTVEGCEIRNTRARALLLQTEQIAVHNCRFFGLTLPALLAAPDLKRWHEVGPVRNMTICRNTFVKCGFSGTAGEIPVIAVQACHDAADTGGTHVHRNIRRGDGRQPPGALYRRAGLCAV